MSFRWLASSAFRTALGVAVGACLVAVGGCETFFGTGSIERKTDEIARATSKLQPPEQLQSEELEMYRNLTVEPLMKGARLYRLYLNTGDIRDIKADAATRNVDVSFSADVEPGWYRILDKTGQFLGLLNEIKKKADSPLVTTVEGRTEISYVPSMVSPETLVENVKELFPDIHCGNRNGAVVITNPPTDAKTMGNLEYVLEQGDRMDEKRLDGGGQVYYIEVESPEQASYLKRNLDAEILRDPLAVKHLSNALEADGLDSTTVERLKVGITGNQILVWDPLDDPTRRRRDAILAAVNRYCRDFAEGLAAMTEGAGVAPDTFRSRMITQEIDLTPQCYLYRMKAKRPEDQKEFLDQLAGIKGVIVGRGIDDTQQVVLYDELGTAQAAVNRLIDEEDFLGEQLLQDGKSVLYFYTVKSAGQKEIKMVKDAAAGGNAYMYPSLEGLAQALKGALVGANITVTAVDRLNSLVITDPDGSHKKDIEAVLRRLDKRAPMVGLYILVTESFADITEDFTSQVGLSFVPPHAANPRPVPGLALGDVSGGTRLLGSELRSPDRAQIGVVFGIETEHFKAYLDMLRSKGYSVDILRPYLQVANRQIATARSTERIPVQQQTLVGSNVVTTVRYEDVADAVVVRPTVHKDGYVAISVRVETGDTSQPMGPLQVPVITKREINISEVLLREGQTLIIAGILAKRDFGVMRGAPWWLSNWPILGTMFRSKDKEELKREIIVTITPDIIDTQHEMKGIAETLEELARAYYRVKPPEVAPVEAPTLTPEERAAILEKGAHAKPEEREPAPSFEEEARIRELRRSALERPAITPEMPAETVPKRKYWFTPSEGRAEPRGPAYVPAPKKAVNIFGDQLYRHPTPTTTPEVIKPQDLPAEEKAPGPAVVPPELLGEPAPPAPTGETPAPPAEGTTTAPPEETARATEQSAPAVETAPAEPTTNPEPEISPESEP